jgi:hypothetical protein
MATLGRGQPKNCSRKSIKSADDWRRAGNAGSRSSDAVFKAKGKTNDKPRRRVLRLICQGDPVRVSMCHCLECQRRTESCPLTFHEASRLPTQAEIRADASGRATAVILVAPSRAIATKPLWRPRSCFWPTSAAIRRAAAGTDDLNQFRWPADGRLPLIRSAC